MATRRTPRSFFSLHRCVCFIVSAALWLAAPGVASTQESLTRLIDDARRFEEQGAPARAKMLFQRVLAEDERNLGALLGLGRVAGDSGDWSEAGKWAERALNVDDDSMEAHYLRAVAYRERARYRLLQQHVHWSGAEKHFEWILERDSLYEDVLLQYARLRQYGGDHRAALRLGHAQIRLRPDLQEAHAGVFDIYRAFVRHADLSSVRAWQSERPSKLSAYFVAERLRLDEAYAEAESLLKDLQGQSDEHLRVPILLSRARVHYALGESESAQTLIERAVNEIDDALDAQHVFEQIKYLMSGEELRAYRALRTPSDLRKFFVDFWVRRDPMPARPTNVRMTDHYHRLAVAERNYVFDGVRFWFNNPDKMHVLDYPAAFYLNNEFNDRGLIYIRHGEPRERVRSVGPGVPANESWRYDGLDMDFHFVIDEGGAGNNWQLTPVLETPHLLRNRETWGGVYLHLLKARSELEYRHLQFTMADESREMVWRGLTTETHTWSDTLRILDFPYVLAAFREEDGRTRVELYTLLPGEVEGRQVEVGRAIFDTHWTALLRGADTLRAGSDPHRIAGGVTSANLILKPARHHVALHVRELGGRMIGGYRFDYDVPDFSGAGPATSDVLLFQPVEDESAPAAGYEAAVNAGAPDRLRRGRVIVGPHVHTRLPLRVYFEMYGLSTDEEGFSRYAVEYDLVPEGGRRKILGLFGPVVFRPSLSLSTEHQEHGPAPVETAGLDLTAVDPGSYVLTVTVRDLLGGDVVERSRSIRLER